MQLSTSFLLPMLELPPIVYKCKAKTYIGHSGYEERESWGNFLYLQVSNNNLQLELLSHIRNHSQFIGEFEQEDTVFFIFKVTDAQRFKIVNPFINGDYSKIDREYVTKYFPQYKTNGEISLNWRILNKDMWDIPHNVIPLRKYWYSRIGVEIPEDAEVWLKPKKEHEIYNYEDLDALLTRELSTNPENNNILDYTNSME